MKKPSLKNQNSYLWQNTLEILLRIELVSSKTVCDYNLNPHFFTRRVSRWENFTGRANTYGGLTAHMPTFNKTADIVSGQGFGIRPETHVALTPTPSIIFSTLFSHVYSAASEQALS